ncbi:MAG: cysteine--tRNA ligase [Desulfobacterales bacterium CG23_combo_of_CG06-09_8_20_14_all_52_9]|nr:MAG: cysteine--tRNA ligase [Desulfobacterales bacterium CG23_combo_of_CG06-09_8_20_14_all_52_9]
MPKESGKVRMYVCGPTVYDSCHIGHARSVVVFDVIARYFRSQGFEVTYVRNFTDIDDKIIQRAAMLGVDPKDLAEKYIREFHQDMDALKVDRATVEPKATDHIPQIIRVIRLLMEKGYAYAADGDIFFSVTAFSGYGKLSGRKLEDMEAGARVDVDARKHDPFDFVLWKSAKPGEPFWESPWGTGRPGWHIECTAMSSEYLGQTFDIHGGGKDLVFPHHENEIAQSEAAFGQPFVNYWVHNGFVNINQEKMSKSLGNFLLIRDLLKEYHPEALRLFLLSSHYRSPIDFTPQHMEEAGAGLDKLYTLLERTQTVLGTDDFEIKTESGDHWARFCEAMDNDFNTALGIGVLFEAARQINRLMDEATAAVGNDFQQQLMRQLRDIRKIGAVLGILTESPKDYFEGRQARLQEKKQVDVATVDALVAERTEARKSKDWARADAIRRKLEAMNVLLEDRPEGTAWKIR